MLIMIFSRFECFTVLVDIARGVVGRERRFHTFFTFFFLNGFEAVLKWLFFGCVPTPFLLALHHWI